MSPTKCRKVWLFRVASSFVRSETSLWLCTDVLFLLCAALLFRLKQKAMQECKEAAQAYAQCCSGRVFSAVWSCRGELSDLNGCLQQQCVWPSCLPRPCYIAGGAHELSAAKAWN